MDNTEKCIDKYVTCCSVDESGVLTPTFKIGDNFSSGYLKYLFALKNKKVKVTIEVLENDL